MRISIVSIPALVAMLLSITLPARAQLGEGAAIPPAEQLVHVGARPLAITAGSRAEAEVRLRIEPGWHVNANPPASDNMIPTTVTLAGAAGVSASRPVYPSPRRVKLPIDENPLLVYDGEAIVRLPLTATADAENGEHVLRGKLRFQTCNDEICLPPTTVPFELRVTVTGGVKPGIARAAVESTATASPATPPGTPGAGEGFTTAPPPKGAGAGMIDNPIARLFERGSLIAFLSLFVIGLALNLTPCVYPMLGVTVSIFGARKAAPPLQVFGLAVLYVLGISVMYSTLGLVAAFTGGLFGGFLQSSIVLFAIGVLLIALSLSMFGLYELQLPPVLLSKLGGAGATGAAGIFLSGLMVGIFAAPCIGPPVVALLALVGAKGDPKFGFLSFFVLSMGLGAPYLVLGTFSNLLQRMPRSGDWMVWVKKVFGVILVGVGLFYALLAVAPGWAIWVMPVALIAGGIYLGFFERSAARRRGFVALKWASGALALIAGIVMIVTSPREGIAFQPLTAGDFQSADARGRPAMVDFTADWCMPCHELERATFTNSRVRTMARGFRAYQVDLTHYDSPEADGWRRRYAITGVPTVIFLTGDGREVREARVEGFLSAERFLERMTLAVHADEQASRQ